MSDGPLLSKKRILDTALKMVDGNGLAKFSMKKLADELGVYPTAVKWHVGTHDELLTALSARMFDGVQLPDDVDRDWRSWLLDTADIVRERMHLHPHLAPLAGSRLSPVAPSLPFVERVLRVLRDVGLRDAALLHSYNTYVGCLLGWVSLELSQAAPSPEQAKANFEGAIDGLDANLYTALNANRELMRDKAFMVRWTSGTLNPLDDSFAFMMRLVIDGIADHASASSKVAKASKRPHIAGETPS